MKKDFDIRKNSWACTQAFRKKETFTKFIIMCQYAGIWVPEVIAETHDIHRYPYIGKRASEKHLVRWHHDRTQEFPKNLRKLTRSEAYKYLKEAIKKRRISK